MEPNDLDPTRGDLLGRNGVGLSAFELVDCGSAGLRWYAVRFNPGQAGLARPALHRLGYRTFLPLLRLRVPDRRPGVGHRVIEQPAFPGYLFAAWATGSEWQRILRQPGVAGVLHRVGDRASPLPVPVGEVEAMLARARDGGVIEDASAPACRGAGVLGREDSLPPIAGGATVRLTGGPLAGARGLCRMDGPARVQVLLEVMGCARVVSVRRRDVEPA